MKKFLVAMSLFICALSSQAEISCKIGDSIDGSLYSIQYVKPVEGSRQNRMEQLSVIFKFVENLGGGRLIAVDLKTISALAQTVEVCFNERDPESYQFDKLLDENSLELRKVRKYKFD